MEPVFYLYLLVGIILLWKGGDMLVAGADAFARSYGVPPTLAGVFILGFGTSMPELAVTAAATLDGNTGIAVGNVVGSKIGVSWRESQATALPDRGHAAASS